MLGILFNDAVMEVIWGLKYLMKCLVPDERWNLDHHAILSMQRWWDESMLARDKATSSEYENAML